MKRKFAVLFALVIACVIIASPVCAYANSAQRYFEGVTLEGIIMTDIDCPVEVKSERLIFDIYDFPVLWEEIPEYKSTVSAEYEFYNPADYNINMQLVFPFGTIPYWVTDYGYADYNKHGVYVNGNKIQNSLRAIYFDMYYGASFDLERDLAKICDERKAFTDYSDDTSVYKYEMQSSFVHNFPDADTPYAQYDISGYNIVLNHYYNSSATDVKIYGAEKVELYSIGKPLSDDFFKPKYYVKAYDSTNGNYKSDTYSISGNTVHSFLEKITFRDLIFANYNHELSVSETDYYNAVSDKFKNKNVNLNSNYSQVISYDLFDLTNELMMWYQYDLSIAAGQTVTNKVVAPIYPSLDDHYNPPKYGYEYLLSPASSWASFANLDITVNTDVFLLESSLEGFTKTDNGYFAHFDELPNGELNFTLCESQNPKYDNSYLVFWILLIICLIALPIFGIIILIKAVIVIILVVILRRRKRQQQGLSEADQVCNPEQKEAAMRDFFTDN